MSASKKEYVIVNGMDDVLTLLKTRKGCYRELAKIDPDGRTWQEIRDDMGTSDHFTVNVDGEWETYSITHMDDCETYGQEDIY